MSYNNTVSSFHNKQPDYSKCAGEALDMISDHLKVARKCGQKYYISEETYQFLKGIRDGNIICSTK